jgi:hypothetical protein
MRVFGIAMSRLQHAIIDSFNLITTQHWKEKAKKHFLVCKHSDVFVLSNIDL